MLVSSEAFLLGLHMATVSLSPDMVFPPCTLTLDAPSSSYKDTSHIGLRPYTYLHLTLITFKGPVYKHSHFRVEGFSTDRAQFSL